VGAPLGPSKTARESSTTAPVSSDFYKLRDEGKLAEAKRWLVGAHAADVLGLATMMVREPAAAEVVTEAVFADAFARLGEAGDDPRAWLLAIARERCIERLQANEESLWGIDSGFDEPPPEGEPDEVPLPFDLVERRADVQSALADLGEAERALIALRYGHGVDYASLALVFKEQEAEIRQRLALALRRMRRALETTVTDLPLDTIPSTPSLERREEIEAAAEKTSSAGLLEIYFAKEQPAVGDELAKRLAACTDE
jgi:RNA polymerase sigma factor (sigma-70 family)